MDHPESANVLHHVTKDPTTAWTRVNAAEALPGLLTPLGWTFWDERVELALRGAFADMGVLATREVVVHPTMDRRISAVFYGRFAGNLDLLRECADRTPGTSGAALEEQLFGAVRAEAVDHPTRRRYPAIAVKLPYAALIVARRVSAARRDTDRWWRGSTTVSAPTTEYDARRLLAEAGARFRRVFRAHLLSTFLCQGVFEQLTLTAAAAGCRGLELRLASGYGGMEEGKVLHDLWAVSRDGLSLQQFVGVHGYHGFSEGDLARTSWREDPTTLESLIESYRRRDESRAPAVMEAERAVERAAAEAELLDGLGRLGRWKARLVLRLAARHIPLREVGKVPFLQAIDVGRCAARVLGDLLHRSGAIDDPNDVVFLTFDELVEGCPANARELIAERQELHRRYSEMDLPQSWVGPPTPICQQPRDAATTELKGLPVFPGVVEGRAVVVHDPRGATGFEDGDILVCEFTDPSWVMLMNLAGALVIDIGGAMSHGAIIARELGIPTVISTGEGTRVLQTGDRLRVDAGAGTVELIERPDRAAMEESR